MEYGRSFSIIRKQHWGIIFFIKKIVAWKFRPGLGANKMWQTSLGLSRNLYSECLARPRVRFFIIAYRRSIRKYSRRVKKMELKKQECFHRKTTFYWSKRTSIYLVTRGNISFSIAPFLWSRATENLWKNGHIRIFGTGLSLIQMSSKKCKSPFTLDC